MKKDFTKDNPAMAYIGVQEEPAADGPPGKPIGRMFSRPVQEPRLNYLGEEAKTERLNCLIKPSTLAGLRKLGVMKKASLNGLLNQAAEELIEREASTIKKYDELHGSKI